MTKNSLKRNVGLIALVLYGVGDILGAGVYGLIGKAAGQMGNGIWLAFLVSMFAAGLTGLTYASLGSRYAKAGGASFITFKAFGHPFLAYLIGMCAFASGLTSMATASKVFAGYFHGLFETIPTPLIVFVFAMILATIVFIGIRESLIFNAICTVIEASGLLFILAVGMPYWGDVNYLNFQSPSNPTGDFTMSLVLTGAVLTFYSFIGFEDIINVAEEVKDPQKNLPRGIVGAVLISSLIYMGISITAVSVVPPQLLAESSQPLVEVVKKAAPWFPPSAFSIIAMFAVANTAMLNFIMGSRLIYGMSNQGLLPKVLSHVHGKTQTPHYSIFAILIIFLILAFTGDVSSLAKATSILLLICFIVVNLSLIRLKKTDPVPGAFEIPSIIPYAGAGVCFLMLCRAQQSEIITAGILIAVIVTVYFFVKPSKQAIEHFEEDV